MTESTEGLGSSPHTEPAVGATTDREHTRFTPVVVHLPLDPAPTSPADITAWIAERARSLVDDAADSAVTSVRHLQRVDTTTAVGVGEDHLVLFELAQPTGLPVRDWIGEAGFGADESVVHGRVEMLHELAPGPSRRGSAILYVHVDADEHHLEPFLDWYVDCHVPAVVAAPGMIGARRLVVAEPRPSTEPTTTAESTTTESRTPTDRTMRRFCTVYEMDDPGVPDRPSTLEAGRIGACPPSLQPHRVARNNAYREVLHLARSARA